ncbi:MAG: hypothetical protein ACXWUG_00310 [Polyangiales bacterium]
MNNDRPDISRRRLLVLGGLGGLGALFVAGCKKAPPVCTDTAGLAPADAEMRKTLAYVEPTGDPNKPCSKCVQFVEPVSSDVCGGCKVLKGPISSNGSCKVWAAKT